MSIPQERAALFEDELQQLLGWLPSPTRGLGHIYTDERHRQGPLAHKLLNASGPEASAAGSRSTRRAKPLCDVQNGSPPSCRSGLPQLAGACRRAQ